MATECDVVSFYAFYMGTSWRATYSGTFQSCLPIQRDSSTSFDCLWTNYVDPTRHFICYFFSCLIFMFKYGDKKKMKLDNNITLESTLTERGRYIRGMCEYLLGKCHLQDMFVYCVAFSNSFILLGRVLTGQCPENTSLFMSQICNPLADHHGIPFEIVLIMYGAPLICHIIYRGTSIWSVLISIVICCGAIVNGWMQTYIVIFSIVFISIVVEMERWMRIAFIRRQLLLETTSLKLVIQHQMLEQKENEVCSFVDELQQKHNEILYVHPNPLTLTLTLTRSRCWPLPMKLVWLPKSRSRCDRSWATSPMTSRRLCTASRQKLTFCATPQIRRINKQPLCMLLRR